MDGRIEGASGWMKRTRGRRILGEGNYGRSRLYGDQLGEGVDWEARSEERARWKERALGGTHWDKKTEGGSDE